MGKQICKGCGELKNNIRVLCKSCIDEMDWCLENGAAIEIKIEKKIN